MIDPADAESVIDRVATTLAYRYWWLKKDDLVSEAWIACKTTDVLTEATSPGAFHERVKMKLIDSQEVEREWREERIAAVELADVSNDGTVYTYGEEGEQVAFGQMGGAPSDGLPKHAPGQRSRLLDRLATMTKDEFIEWADLCLGRRYAKKRDVRTLLYGTSAEQAALWEKYARGKRVNGGKRIVLDGKPTTEGEYQETLAEEWRSRYRWSGEDRARSINAPVAIMSADGSTGVVPRMLRQPVR